VYEDVESEDKERPVCRCKDCLKTILKAEDDLRSAMGTMDYHIVDKVLN